MNPGATTLPVASIVRAAPDLRRRRPGTTIRSPTTATRPGPPGAPVPSTTVPPVISRSTRGHRVSGRRPSRAPGGPSSRRPRTQAARTMSGCGRKISRLTWSRPDRRSRRPATGATSRGSIAIRSASLPASSEPISSVDAQRPAPLERAQPQPVERVRARRRPRPSARRAARSARRRRRASSVKIDSSGPPTTSEPRPDAEPGLAGSAPAASRPTPGTGSRPGSGRPRVPVSTSRAELAVREVDRVGQDRPRAERRRPGRRRRRSRCASGKSRATSRDLAVVLGQVGLPVRAGRARERAPTRAASRPCTRPRTAA